MRDTRCEFQLKRVKLSLLINTFTPALLGRDLLVMIPLNYGTSVSAFFSSKMIQLL